MKLIDEKDKRIQEKDERIWATDQRHYETWDELRRTWHELREVDSARRHATYMMIDSRWALLKLRNDWHLKGIFELMVDAAWCQGLVQGPTRQKAPDVPAALEQLAQLPVFQTEIHKSCIKHNVSEEDAMSCVAGIYSTVCKMANSENTNLVVIRKEDYTAAEIAFLDGAMAACHELTMVPVLRWHIL